MSDEKRPGANPAEQNLVERSRLLQAAYAERRRTWAQAVGRPYDGDPDLRPPPGELDAEAED